MNTPCLMEYYCANSKMISGMDARTKCALCRLSPDNLGRDMTHYWKPSPEAIDLKKTEHPLLIAEKRQKKLSKRASSLAKKRSRDPGKRHVSRAAAIAEKRTQSNIIKATINSGRRNKDGDHVHQGLITLDTKLQSTRSNPIINMAELDKVRSDAQRSGKLIGGLVIRNKHNIGCVVLREEDYVIITGRETSGRVTDD